MRGPLIFFKDTPCLSLFLSSVSVSWPMPSFHTFPPLSLHPFSILFFQFLSPPGSLSVSPPFNHYLSLSPSLSLSNLSPSLFLSLSHPLSLSLIDYWSS